MAALPAIVPHWPGLPANVGALSTTRAGGVSLAPYDDGQGGGGLNLGVHVADDAAHVAQNRARLAAMLPAQPAWLNQVHGVAVADAASLAGRVPDADASVASEPGAVCLVMTADCLPVLFSSSDGQVVARRPCGLARPGRRRVAAHGASHARSAARPISWPGWVLPLVHSNLKWGRMCCKRFSMARWTPPNGRPSRRRSRRSPASRANTWPISTRWGV